MKTLTILSLITLIFSAIQKGEAWRRSTIYVGADDILSKVYLNDNELDLSPSEIITKIMNRFSLTKESAEQYVESTLDLQKI